MENWADDGSRNGGIEAMRLLFSFGFVHHTLALDAVLTRLISSFPRPPFSPRHPHSPRGSDDGLGETEIFLIVFLPIAAVACVLACICLVLVFKSSRELNSNVGADNGDGANGGIFFLVA